MQKGDLIATHIVPTLLGVFGAGGAFCVFANIPLIMTVPQLLAVESLWIAATLFCVVGVIMGRGWAFGIALVALCASSIVLVLGSFALLRANL